MAGFWLLGFPGGLHPPATYDYCHSGSGRLLFSHHLLLLRPLPIVQQFAGTGLCSRKMSKYDATAPLDCKRCGWTHPKDTASAKVGICKYCDRSKHRVAVKALHDGFNSKGPKQTAAGAPKAKPTADVRVKDSAKPGKWVGWVDYPAKSSQVTPSKRFSEAVTLSADIERLRAQGVPQSVIEIVKDSIRANAVDVDPVSLFTSAKQKLANHDAKISSMETDVLDALSMLKDQREALATAKQDRLALADKMEEARAAVAAVPATPSTAPQGMPIIHAETLFQSLLAEFAVASADPGAQAFCGAFKAFVDTKNVQTMSTPDIHMSASPFDRIGLNASAPARPPTATVFPVHVHSNNIDQQGRPFNAVGPFRGRGRSSSQPPSRIRSSSRSLKRRKEDENLDKEAKTDVLAQADDAIAAAEALARGSVVKGEQQL